MIKFFSFLVENYVFAIKRDQTMVNRRIMRNLRSWLRDGRYRVADVGLPEISEELGVTVEQLTFFSRKYLGKPFLTWRKELRIEEAKRMLKANPDMAIREVSAMVGIGCTSNFRRQFKEMEGVTLSQWRKSNAAAPTSTSCESRDSSRAASPDPPG